MRTYTVTASNAYFWQKLVVQARSERTAARKFSAFLRSRSSQAQERYEWDQGNKLSPDGRCDRAAYDYGFDDDKVVEADALDFARPVGVKVHMMDSGGNG
jgi:hypothetical protein